MTDLSPLPWRLRVEGQFSYLADANGKRIGVLYGRHAQIGANAVLIEELTTIRAAGLPGVAVPAGPVAADGGAGLSPGEG